MHLLVCELRKLTQKLKYSEMNKGTMLVLSMAGSK